MSTTFVIADFRTVFYRFIVLPLKTCKIGFLVFTSTQQRRIVRKTKRQRPLSVQLLNAVNGRPTHCCLLVVFLDDIYRYRREFDLLGAGKKGFACKYQTLHKRFINMQNTSLIFIG